jgi:hypothetical protein
MLPLSSNDSLTPDSIVSKMDIGMPTAAPHGDGAAPWRGLAAFFSGTASSKAALGLVRAERWRSADVVARRSNFCSQAPLLRMQ